MDLPRPEVTVTDPRQPGPLVAVEEPPPPRLGRRGAALLGAVALLGATVLVVADTVRDRRDAVEQRRLAGEVDLALVDKQVLLTASYDEGSGTGTVRGLVRVVNRGPTEVRVVGAALGRMRASGSGTTVEADGGEAVLQLQQTVRCPSDGGRPQPQPAAEGLRLLLDTRDGPQDVSLVGDGLPQASLVDTVQRACSHTPLRESLQVAATVVRTEDRAAVLQVDVANHGRVPLRLLSLVPARGLVVESISGDATGLPLLLPLRTGRLPAVRTLEVRLGVVCGALLGADLLTPFEELTAIVEDEGRSAMTSIGSRARDPERRLRQLAGRTCSSG